MSFSLVTHITGSYARMRYFEAFWSRMVPNSRVAKSIKIVKTRFVEILPFNFGLYLMSLT
jgi:hypothetical protein